MGAPALTEAAIRGTSIWDHMHGEGVHHLMRKLIGHVRQTRQQIVVPFRCDAATTRILMELMITPADKEGLHVSTCVVRTEERVVPILFDETVVFSNGWVVFCSWCNCIKVSEELWLEVEDAIKVLELFDDVNKRPQVTHGICDECATVVLDDL